MLGGYTLGHYGLLGCAAGSTAIENYRIDTKSCLLKEEEKIFSQLDIRPRRWSIFQSDGMVNVYFQATIDFNGFSMVLTLLDHHH